MGGSGFALPTVVDTIFRALAEAMPHRVSAGHHATYGTHAFQGISPLTGEPFQHLESSIGGWGATARTDGASPFRTLVAGDMFDTSAESMEANFPIRVRSARLLPDSGGAGTFRGGLGTTKVFEILAPCIMIVYFERTKCPPWGLRGGKAGAPGYVELFRPGCAPQRILKGNDISLLPGDVIQVVAGGGGGFGPPAERALARILEDVSLGKITVPHAIAEYGVDPTAVHEIDRDFGATRQPRSQQISDHSIA
jgi:N-methylhydantoinase B